MRTGASTPIGNAVILLAGGFLIAGVATALAIIFVYATCVVLGRRLSRQVSGFLSPG